MAYFTIKRGEGGTTTVTSTEVPKIVYGTTKNTSSVGLTGSKGKYLGAFKVTGYCSCKICCGNYSYEVTGRVNRTKSGTIPQDLHTLAADWSVLPKGTKVLIEGYGNTVFTVEDVGGAIKGNHIDLYRATHDNAKKVGNSTHSVWLAQEVESQVDKSVGSSDIPDSKYKSAALKYLNIPYVYGGKNYPGDGGLDCSGFVWHLMSDLGYSWVTSVGNSNAQKESSYGTSIELKGTLGLGNARAGDLLFNGTSTSGISHVMCYLGNGWIVHAPHTGSFVKFAKVWKTPVKIVRLGV